MFYVSYNEVIPYEVGSIIRKASNNSKRVATMLDAVFEKELHTTGSTVAQIACFNKSEFITLS